MTTLKEVDLTAWAIAHGPAHLALAGLLREADSDAVVYDRASMGLPCPRWDFTVHDADGEEIGSGATIELALMDAVSRTLANVRASEEDAIQRIWEYRQAHGRLMNWGAREE